MRALSAAAGTVVFLLWAVECFSQATDTDLYAKAKQLQSPLAVKTSITLLENILFNIGPEKKTGNALTFQPIVPVRINPEWNLLTQTNLQLISLPSSNPEQGHINGLGDTTFYAVVSPDRTAEGSGASGLCSRSRRIPTPTWVPTNGELALLR